MNQTTTAQLVALLLQQQERTNEFMESLVRENRKLWYVHALMAMIAPHSLCSSVITAKLQSMKLYMVSNHRSSTKMTDNEESGLQSNEDEDTAVEGDNELEKQVANCQACKQKKQLSGFKDSKYKPALMYLQVCRLCVHIHVCEHLFFLFDVTNMKELVAKNKPITDKEMKNNLDGEDLITCSLQHYCIDFQRPWKDTDFNKLARDVFIKSFLVMQKSGKYSDEVIPPCLLTPKVVEVVLDKHMDYRCKLYRNYLSPLIEADTYKLLKWKAMKSRRQTVCTSTLLFLIELN